MQPMDIDIQGVSIADTKTKALFGSSRLGLWTLFQPSEVLNLRIFTYDRKT